MEAPLPSVADADAGPASEVRWHAEAAAVGDAGDENPYDEWRQLVGGASDLFRRPLDEGPILQQLMRAFPGSLGQYMKEFEHSERRPAREGRPQRDLLPLPAPD